MPENRYIIPTAILSVAAILCAFILSGTLRRIKSDNQIITVTGSAKQVIVSDFGILRGTIMAEAPTASEAYRSLQAQKPILLAYLKSKGFPEDKVNFQTLSSNPNYTFSERRENMGIRSYTASQMIDVTSGDVNLIRAMSLEISSLVERGITFQVNPPEYYYTKLGDIKIEIQAEAAKDAMIRGQRIAEATGRELGTLVSARMGVLQIIPENSNLISDYGVNDASSICKEIIAVVNANFNIE